MGNGQPFCKGEGQGEGGCFGVFCFPPHLNPLPPQKKGERRQGLITQIRSCTRACSLYYAPRGSCGLGESDPKPIPLTVACLDRFIPVCPVIAKYLTVHFLKGILKRHIVSNFNQQLL